MALLTFKDDAAAAWLEFSCESNNFSNLKEQV